MKRLILSLILTIPAIAAAASFQGLGAGSVANDISADGTVVVGSGRWTQPTSWQDIGATATACSADGSVVVGYRPYVDYMSRYVKKPIYWTASEGTVDISGYSGNNAQATDVSDDGSVIVGYTNYQSNISNFYKEAFLYDRSQDSTIGLGDLDMLSQQTVNQEIGSAAYAVSGDGTIVAGSGIPYGYLTPNAMTWTDSGGMVNISPADEPDNRSSVMGMSRDGTMLIGQSGPSAIFISEVHAVYWTEQEGMQYLGEIEGLTDESCALAISDDLSTIVGWASDGYGEYAAFLWNELQGMLNLQELLQTTYEFNIDDWTLTEATGISADGLTIIGNGINPDGHKEAWIATIPEPASLLLLAVGTCWVRRRHQR